MENIPLRVEISPNGNALIQLYRETLEISDEKEKSEKLNLFCTKLIGLIDPSHDQKFSPNIGTILDLFKYGGQLNFGTGTSGERVFFYNFKPGGDLDEHTDAPVRYMVLNEGEFDWQKDIRGKWVDIFGDITVDLLQNNVNSVEKSDKNLTPEKIISTYQEFLNAINVEQQKVLLKKFLIQIHAIMDDDNPELVVESEYPWDDDEEMIDVFQEFSKPKNSTFIGGTAGHRVYFETGIGDEEGKVFIKYSEPTKDGLKKHWQSFMDFFGADRVEIYGKGNLIKDISEMD